MRDRLCGKQGVGVMPRSPLARDYLTRPHEEFEAVTRGRTDEHTKGHPYFKSGGREVSEYVEELVNEEGAKMAQLALSWILHKDWVDAPIVSTSSIEHLEDAVRTLNIALSDSNIDYLEKPYQPVRVSSHD